MRISDWSSDVCSSDLQSNSRDRPGGAVNSRGVDFFAGAEPNGRPLGAVHSIKTELSFGVVESYVDERSRGGLVTLQFRNPANQLRSRIDFRVARKRDV